MKFHLKNLSSLPRGRSLALVVVATVLGGAIPASAEIVTVWEDQFTSISPEWQLPSHGLITLDAQPVPGDVVGSEDGFEGRFDSRAGSISNIYITRTIPADLVKPGDRVEYAIRTQYPTNYAADRINLVAPVGGTDFDSGFVAHDSPGALTYQKEPGTLFDLFDTTLQSGLRAQSNLWFGNNGWGGAGVDSIFYVDYIRIVGDRAPVNADFNGNSTVDAADYVLWRKNAGTMGTGTQPTGDANGDTNINSVDYDLWRGRFGLPMGSGGGLGSGGVVPEPGTWSLAFAASMLLNGRRLRRGTGRLAAVGDVTSHSIRRRR